jgi:L-asparaginase
MSRHEFETQDRRRSMAGGSRARRVTLLVAGGTIGMSGKHAVPAREVPFAIPDAVTVEVLDTSPSPHRGLAQTLALCERALAAARGGSVVVTHGTDTLEEAALLCDLLYSGKRPLVFTGAMRPAQTLGSDGEANLADALAVARCEAAAGLGVVVVLGGEIHAAQYVRKASSVALNAFESPIAGPIGLVVEGRVRLLQRPPRNRPLVVGTPDHRVEIVHAGLGSDGQLVSELLNAAVDGLVVVALGAGHLPPLLFRAVEEAARGIPVVVVVRPERGAILHRTYGFFGAEHDVRRSAAIPAAGLSPAAARIALLAGLAARLDADGLRELFGRFDV